MLNLETHLGLIYRCLGMSIVVNDIASSHMCRFQDVGACDWEETVFRQLSLKYCSGHIVCWSLLSGEFLSRCHGTWRNVCMPGCLIGMTATTMR